jgi:negative regulator of sigma E activity
MTWVEFKDEKRAGYPVWVNRHNILALREGLFGNPNTVLEMVGGTEITVQGDLTDTRSVLIHQEAIRDKR